MAITRAKDPKAPIISTVQQQAYAYLRNQIISGRYPAGMHLKAEEIAHDLGISRIPVREALRQLDAEGLVIIRPNRGATVTNLTPNDVLELFEMRAVLEGLAVRYAVPRITPQVTKELDHLLQSMRRQRDYLQWLERHDEFHQFLCQLSGLTRVCDQITKLRHQVRPYLRLYATAHENPELSGYEHELILDAIRASDPERAEQAARAHVRENGVSIVKQLERSGDARSENSNTNPAS